MKLTKKSILEITQKGKKIYPRMLADIQETFEINETCYKEGSEFSLENGYGFHMYLVMSLQEYLNLAKEINLYTSCFLETEDIVFEDNQQFYIRQLFLCTDDSGYVIYIKL